MAISLISTESFVAIALKIWYTHNCSQGMYKKIYTVQVLLDLERKCL